MLAVMVREKDVTTFNMTLNTTQADEKSVVEVTINGDTYFRGLFLLFETEKGVCGGDWQYPEGYSRPSRCGIKNIALGHNTADPKKAPQKFYWTVPTASSVKADFFILRGIVVEDLSTYGLMEPLIINVTQVLHPSLLCLK
jgi:hypothetical protein